MSLSGDGGRVTEDRGQKSEDRGQKSEDGGQKSEDGGQTTEDGGQKAEDGGRRTDVFEVGSGNFWKSEVRMRKWEWNEVGRRNAEGGKRRR